MLTFEELRSRLIDDLRSRVRNGEVTERRLARVTGISQPHIHNLLKGVRVLTPDLGDQILKSLHISLTDFIDIPPSARNEMGSNDAAGAGRYIDLLDGYIGPYHPWPSQVSSAARLKITDPITIRMINPVGVRAAEDARMEGVFSKDDIAVLDQSLGARTEIDPDSLYLVKSGDHGLIRRCAMSSTALYVFTEDCRLRPGAWQRIPLSAVPAAQMVRAQVRFPASDDQWEVRFA
jgi:hypothetical protein